MRACILGNWLVVGRFFFFCKLKGASMLGVVSTTINIDNVLNFARESEACS
jgi:hypothetical protein